MYLYKIIKFEVVENILLHFEAKRDDTNPFL